MATIILLHGAFHGGWCWEHVAPVLEGLGHVVHAPDLPLDGHGSETGADWLAKWVDSVCETLPDDAEERVLLVGHSRAGLLIQAVAEKVPERLLGIVFVAAMMVRSGESMADARARMADHVPPAMAMKRVDGGFLPEDAAVTALICPDASSTDQARTLERLRAEPKAGFAIAPVWSPERAGTVAVACIECTRDAVFPLPLQRAMRVGQRCDVVITLDADHAPNYSSPVELAQALDVITRRFGDGADRSGSSINETVDLALSGS